MDVNCTIGVVCSSSVGSIGTERAWPENCFLVFQPWLRFEFVRFYEMQVPHCTVGPIVRRADGHVVPPTITWELRHLERVTRDEWANDEAVFRDEHGVVISKLRRYEGKFRRYESFGRDCNFLVEISTGGLREVQKLQWVNDQTCSSVEFEWDYWGRESSKRVVLGCLHGLQFRFIPTGVSQFGCYIRGQKHGLERVWSSGSSGDPWAHWRGILIPTTEYVAILPVAEQFAACVPLGVAKRLCKFL